MPRETDSKAIAEAARGEIDPELLTKTGSGGFLSTGYFHDGPLIDRLQSDEQLQYVVTNLTKGITIDRSTEMEQVQPDTNYRTAALVTDQRTCFVIGQSQSDTTVSVPHDTVEGVETSTGILKDKLVIHGQDADYQMYTAKHAATQATADYIEHVAPHAGWTTLESDQSNQDNTPDSETASHDRNDSGARRSRVPTESSDSRQPSPDAETTTGSAGTTTDAAAVDDTAEIEDWSARSRDLQKQAEKRTVTDGRGADSAPPAVERDSNQETAAATDTNTTHSDTATESETSLETAPKSGTETQPTLPSPASVATNNKEAATYVANAQGAVTAGLLDSSRSAQIRAHTNICTALEILAGTDTDVRQQLETAATALEDELMTSPEGDGTQDQEAVSHRSGSTASQQSDEAESSAGETSAETTEHREELLAELDRLDAEWSQDINKVLMHSVSEYDPADYEDEFGSWDTALRQADLQTESSDEADPETKSSDKSNLQKGSSDEADETGLRNELLAELERLDTEWSKDVDKVLMYSVGEYDPDDYVDEFGSWDTALQTAFGEDTAGESGDEPSQVNAAQTPASSDDSTSDRSKSETADLTGKDNSDQNSSDADGDATDKGETDATVPRDQLLAELDRIKEEWDPDPDEILMEVFGEYDPADYETEFGSWDAALRQANLRDGESADQDTTSKQSTVTTDTPADDQTSGQEPEADFAPNELAEYYDAIGLLWNTLDRLLELDDLRHINTTRKTLKEWYDAVHERWTEEGVRNAPSYGEQQYSRNSFAMSEYRDVFGDGDRVTEFHRIDVEPLPPSERSVLTEQGIIADADDYQTPVAPDSDEPLPVIVKNRHDLQQAKDRLDELPAWPAAENSPGIETDSESDESRLESLPEGRLEKLYVTVQDINYNPDDHRIATLTVSLDDGSETMFTSWEKHALNYDWTTGQRYLLRKVRHTSWESDSGPGHKLSSTRDTTVKPTDAIEPAQQTDQSESQESNDGEDSDAETDMIDSMLDDMDF